MTTLAFWLGTTVGVVGGFGLAATLTAGKLADTEAEKAAAFRAGRMLGRVMGAIEHQPPPMDDGARLLREIEEELYLHGIGSDGHPRIHQSHPGGSVA